MLLQRLHFLRRLIPNVIIYKTKERVEYSTRSFVWDFGLRVRSEELIIIAYSLLPVPYFLLIIL